MRRLLILLGLIFCASPVWGQTPGFFRSVNSSWSNITGTPTGTYGTYVWYNPGAVGSGNAVVAHFKDNTSVSSTPTIADDGSNSYTHEVTETDSNTNRLETFVALNAATARKITATESSNNDYLQGDADEFYNIATSGAVDNTSGTTGTTTGGTTDTISVGNMTGLTSGDMIEVACIADSGKINHTWTVGSGQTGITWQAGDMNAIDGFATEHGVLTGTSINPQINLLNANAVTYACTAVALKAASAGTAPAAGVIYVDNMQHISNCIGADTSSCTSSPTSIVYQFPVNGTVLTFDYHTGSSAQIPTAISDSEMNTWHHVCDIDGLQGAPSERWWTTRTAGYDVDSITVTLNSNTNDGSAGDLLDYVNASTLDTTVGTSGCYSVTAALATSGVSVGQRQPHSPLVKPMR